MLSLNISSNPKDYLNIIKFHFRKRNIFNVVSAMEDYAVKHTHVATPNVVISDERIMETQEQRRRKKEHRI